MPDMSIRQFKFDEDFLKKTNLLLDTYQEALDQLGKLSRNPGSGIDDLYGVCNNRYRIRYITPSDIATAVSFLSKSISNGMTNVNDLELLAVSILEQSVQDNKECVPFEYNTVYPTGTYMNPRTTTMSELVLICRNEYYDTCVVSKSDMIQRAEAMKPSVALMEGIRFTSNVRKLVAQIPNIVNSQIQTNEFNFELLSDFVERFIQTACMINLATVEQLLAYCVPRTSYNLTKIVKDPDKRLDYDYYGEGTVYFSDGIVSESVDLSKNTPVFVNLSHGGYDFLHKSIRKFSNAVWAHSSISFDPHMNVMYTMNGGPFDDNVYGKQKPGFQKEALHSTKYNDVLVRVYVFFVPNEVAKRMQEAVDDFEAKGVKYDYKACADKIFDEHTRKGDNVYKQICSTFVNTIIAIAGKPLSDEEVASPQELADMANIHPNQIFKLYEGPGGQYDYDEAMEKLTEFAQRSSTTVYSESYVTECCMLKTNTLRIRGNIPFNCNMRDIVLQDVHPQFKDTKSAVHFIMTDNRSPISSLVRKFKTVNDYPVSGMILNSFAHVKPFMQDGPNPDLIRNKLGMHTDVNWLDKITYGNNFLDGNYREDAMGNNKFSPIEQSLDTIYRMFNPCGLKTNEELANNVYTVACAMDSIIDQYVSGPSMNGYTTPAIDNVDVVRDMLALLGEIMTRSMLMLFDNNARYISASDDMVESGGPGYMYTEGFVLEADAQPKMGVQVVSKNGGNSEQAKSVLQNIGGLLSKFTNWLATTFAKIAGKFSNDHNAEINWVTKNSALNAEIEKALPPTEGQQGSFMINLTQFPAYNLQVKSMQTWHFASAVEQALSNNEPFKGTKQLIPLALDDQNNTELKNALSDESINNNVQAQADIIQNWILYGKTTVPPPQASKQLTGEIWRNDIVDGITNMAKALQVSEKAMANDLKNASDEIKKAIESAKKGEPTPAKPSTDNTDEKGDATPPVASPAAETGSSTTGESPKVEQSSVFDFTSPIFMEADTPNQVDTTKVQKLQAISKSLTDISRLFQVNAINATIKKFYADTYKIYRDVVTAYKQQSKSEQTPAQPATPAAPAAPAT